MVIRENQSGVALLAVIFLMVVIAFMGVIFLSLSSTNLTQSVNEVYSSKALYIAEGGLERAGRYLLNREDGTQTTYTCDTGASSVNTIFSTPTPLGNGQFKVTSVLNNTLTPTTLSAGGINNLVTTIPTTSVSLSTDGYASFGQIMIDKEKINYTSLSATAFFGAIRGAEGSTTSAHSGGTRIAQTQCTLTSTGGVPTIGAGTNQRVISMADVLQVGWAVGTVGGGTTHPTMLRWDGSVWTNQTGNAPPNLGNLTSVYLTSPADGWATSDNGGTGNNNMIRWNGSLPWSNYVLGAAATLALRGIFMNSYLDGWAVGDAGGVAANQPQTLYWNGTTSLWADSNSNLNINQNLNGVYCNGSATCWAVGANGTIIYLTPVRWYSDAQSGTCTIASSASGCGISITNNTLRAITCVAANDCWAVGSNGTIIRYNGTWASAASPVGVTLRSITCITSSDCWAVGNAGGAASRRPLTIHWNGAVWSVQDNTALNINLTLRSVTCVTTADCWAVGSNGLLIHWGGTTWLKDSQSGVVTTNQLNSVFIFGPKRPNISWQEVLQ
jgi:Tfp pilus assembly protein PilX